MSAIHNLLFGSNGGLTHKMLQGLTARNQFSDYLPYLAYDESSDIYLNIDDTLGFLWECTPLVYAGTSTVEVLQGLFTAAIPEKSILQFILYADPYIDPVLNHYKALRQRQSSLITEATSNVADFFQNGARQGVRNFQGTPIRNFRLFVALKLPNLQNLNILDIRDTVYEVLKGAYLSPRNVSPADLIFFLQHLFNETPPKTAASDNRRPLRKQVILSETPVHTRWDRMEIGNRHFRCLSPKVMPDQVDEFLFNHVSGDIWGVQSDTNQIKQPFMVVTNVIFESLRAKLHAKCNFVLSQQAIGSFATSLKRKQEEYTWAAGEVEKGTPFVRIMPFAWTIGNSEQEARESLARIKRIWESRGFTMQEDKGMIKIFFLSSLPFGLYNIKSNINDIDRDFICNAKAAAYCLPIQADYSGGQEPYNLFVGRKGQIIGIDIFDSQSNNMNALIAAESGSGKSFFTNNLVFNYYAAGSIVRLIDVGGSYKKLCKMLDGVFIEFSKQSKIVINPFSNVIDINEDASAIAAIIAQMAFSSTNMMPNETERTLIKNAVHYAYENYREDADINTVYEYLTTFPKYADEMLDLSCNDDECVSDLKLKAQNIAFNLRGFTSRGEFGRWFNGPSTLNISHDEFVVLELEELKKQQELFKVITLQVLNYVTQDLYLSDRSRRRLVIFDEAWQFFKEGEMLKNIIEEGYRRARKYGGSFTTITQSLLDLEQFGSVGEVIRDNSAYKFLLQSQSFEKAKNKKIIDYDDFMMRLLKSVKSPRPRYSEIFMDTPVGTGISRLIVDPFSYYLFTSDGEENAEIERRAANGKTYAEVITEMIGEKK